MTKQRLAFFGWIATATIVLLYVPMAAEYMFRFFGGGPRLWDHTYASVVGDQHALGAGSIHAVEDGNYTEQRWVMLVHTVVASIAIALSIFQISRRSRRRIAVHRWTGRVQVGLVLVAMAGSMTFLTAVGPENTFDGPAFHLQLWALALGVSLGTVFGVLAIRAGHTSTHRIFMVYAFALLCTAPMLRVGYLLFGVAWRGSSQEVTNLAGAAVLAVFAPMAAILASRRVPAPRKRGHLAELPGPRLERLSAGLGGLGAAALVVGYLDFFDGLDRITLTALIANLLGLALVTFNRRAAAEEVAVEEWRIHQITMMLAAPMTGLLWLAYSVPFTVEQAFYAALLTGPATTLSVGLVLVAWRRRRPARPTAVPAQPPAAATI
jgi:uncharacterized membrane protein YozB (DUF420 family)